MFRYCLRPGLVAVWVVLCLSARADIIIGRAPRSGIERIIAGSFVQTDVDDLLAVEPVGRLPLALRPGLAGPAPRLFRLSLLSLSGREVREIWQSPPLLADACPEAQLAPNAWTVMDTDGDGRLELLIFTADRCRVTSFGPDSITTREFVLSGAWVADAVAAEFDDSGREVLVTLEIAPTDSLLTARLLRVYDLGDSAVTALSDYLTGMLWQENTDLLFTGSAQVEGYPGRLPVIAGVRREPGPTALAALYPDESVGYRFTTTPFPLREWFARDEILPGGRLVLTNQGDTLVAYGYFVPGARPGGPAFSFAGLEDGAWPLLPVTEPARYIGWPACPFRHGGRSGWLELRDGLFRFHPDPVFRW